MKTILTLFVRQVYLLSYKVFDLFIMCQCKSSHIGHTWTLKLQLVAVQKQLQQKNVSLGIKNSFTLHHKVGNCRELVYLIVCQYELTFLNILYKSPWWHNYTDYHKVHQMQKVAITHSITRQPLTGWDSHTQLPVSFSIHLICSQKACT